MKSVYSLVLSDDVIAKVDELAFRNGVSRSQFINEVLAERVGVDTKKKRISDIFEEINALADSIGSMRVQRRQQSCVDFMSALDYKYNPRVTYTVELFGDGYSTGELKIALRTTNPMLLNIIGDFFNDFIATEKSYDNNVEYDVRDGKLIRKLDFKKSPDKSVSRAVTDYVRSLDLLLKLYVNGYGSGEKQALSENYAKVMGKMRV